MLTNKVCQNCDYKHSGKFCPSCGQQYLEGRFKFKESIGWLFDKLLNLEKGLIYTIKELTFNTHEMLSRYLSKATIAYMHPFRFAFLMATISALITIYSGMFDSSVMAQATEGWNSYDAAVKPSAEELKSISTTLETIKKYLALLMLANIPFYAFSAFILYYKKKRSFTEHLIINCYALGFALIIGLSFNLLMFFENGILYHSIVSTISTLLCYSFVYSRFFKENYFLSFLKTILCYVFFGIIIFTVGVLVGIVSKFVMA